MKVMPRRGFSPLKSSTSSDLNFDGAEPQSTVCHSGIKRVYDDGIELRPRQRFDLSKGVIQIHRRLIRTIRRHRIERVGDADDAGKGRGFSP